MKTDRTKHPQCRWCKRTLKYVFGEWRHKKSGWVLCHKSRQSSITRTAEPELVHDFVARR